MAFELNPGEAKTMVRLGIDLGGTNIAVGVVNEQNEIIGTASVKTNAPRPAEEIADSMREACLLALGEARMTLDEYRFPEDPNCDYPYSFQLVPTNMLERGEGGIC